MSTSSSTLASQCSSLLQSVEHLGFEALRFVTAEVEVVLSPFLGGRITGYGPPGSNLLFVNARMRGVRPNRMAKRPADVARERKAAGYLAYGGEKTWLAPQEDWQGPPYADLDHGPYDVEVLEEDQVLIVVLTSSICRETRLRLVRTVALPHEGTQVRVTQRLENHGSESTRKGLWQVTMLNRPGRVRFSTQGPSAFPSGLKNFSGTPPAMMTRNGVITVACEEARRFKVGTDVSVGFVEVWLPVSQATSAVILRKSFPVSAGPYGHGCAVEVYNDARLPYFELEVHGPLVSLAPGQTTEYLVVWSLSRATSPEVGA